ncbi:MAG: hypothetical protein JXQ83_06115 [Candidatus Glassbacteria bacterium]|nr:hypothetical protein [Candidatus Glassbacteria bacterium]
MIILVFMLMIFLGSPIHLLIKFRSYLSTPLMPYKMLGSLIGLFYLIAFGLTALQKRIRNPFFKWGIVLIVWGDIMFCALRKPVLLNALGAAFKSGYYPHPATNLQEYLSSLLNIFR